MKLLYVSRAGAACCPLVDMIAPPSRMGRAWEMLEDWVERGLPAYRGPVRLQGQGIVEFGVEVPLGALLFTVIYSPQSYPTIPHPPPPCPKNASLGARSPYPRTTSMMPPPPEPFPP